MADLPVKVVQVDPADYPNHENEYTLVEYAGFRVGIGPAVRGLTIDGGEPMFLPIEHNGMTARIVTKEELEDAHCDSLFITYGSGLRYQAHMQTALKIVQTFWVAADTNQGREPIEFLVKMLELRDGPPEGNEANIPDGTHRTMGLSDAE